MDVFDLVVLAVGLVVILAGAELFTNGIEWFGHKLNLAEGAVGSVLAAVGTALPETLIPIVAIVFAGQASGDTTAGHGVGVGAILGAPFMLGTLAMFVTGVAVWAQRKKRPTGDQVLVDAAVLRKDVLYFFVAYLVAVGTAFVPSDAGIVRIGAAIVLIGLYALYVRAHFIADPDVDASDIGHLRELAPLRLHGLDVAGKRAEPSVPRLRIVNLQVLIAIAFILGGSVVFVDAVEHLSSSLGVPAGPRADRRADRHRAAREVQQRHLGAPGQGHAGPRQHHRRDGLPVVHPDGLRDAARRRRLEGGLPFDRVRAVVRLRGDRVPLDGGDLPADHPAAAA